MGNKVLVDYDNLDYSDKSRGIRFVIEKILNEISPSSLRSHNLLFRLYGGWYESQRLTHLAQALSTDILATFPTVMVLNDRTTYVIVNVEIAYSLLCNPSHHLVHTFRRRQMPTGMQCTNPLHIQGCNISQCPLSGLHDFITNKVCPQCNTIRPSQVFHKGEQKLIDTMLTSDLIFLSNREDVVIVSSDDDFWPGILTALNNGVKVTQIHTKNRCTNPYYLRTANSNYIQKTI